MLKRLEEMREQYEGTIYHPPYIGIEVRDFNRWVEVGDEFGKLVVLGWQFRAAKVWRVVCECKCGRVFAPRVLDLSSEKTRSCGCSRSEKLSHYGYRHGESKSQLYWAWRNMRSKCECKSHKYYPDNGGAGIKIYSGWSRNYMRFAKWARSNGFVEGKVLSRIDSTKDFDPDNCKWITLTELRNKQKSVRMIEYNGKRMNLRQWADHLGMDQRSLRSRLNMRWPIERALTEPIRKKVKRNASN